METSKKNPLPFSNKDLTALILPLVVEQFLAVLVGLIDSIMVASVNEAAMSAVSLVDTINVLLINIFAALATGGAVVSGQYIGQKRKEEASKAGEQLMVFIFIIALAIMALVYVGKHFILHTIFGQITEEVSAYADTYLMIVTASIPFIALYNAGAALFRAMGDSKVSMLTSLLMNGINIAGNAVLIYGLHFKVEGVAIPTLISRMVAAVVITVLLCNQKLVIHISMPFRYHFDKNKVKKILYIGIPNGIENSMFQLGKIVLLSLVSTFGTASIAANAVSNIIAGFAILPGMAIGLALITVVSQCVGAKDYEQAHFYTKKLMCMALGAMVVTNVLIALALGPLLSVYHLSGETEHMARQILIMHSICACFIWAFSFTLPNTLRAASDVKFAMVVSVGSMWICRIVFGIILGKYAGFGVLGVWMAMIMDWCVRSLFFIIRYKSGKWET